jgi:uncharacterized glyoxalase superfamily protein PhnB
MNRFQPDDCHTVIPRIITSTPEELVRFIKALFRGEGEFQVNRPSEIKVGDSVIMVSDGGGVREPMAAFLYVYVENVDETYGRAIELGAKTLEPPSDVSYGDRRATVKDTWGNLWQIATHQSGTQ